MRKNTGTYMLIIRKINRRIVANIATPYCKIGATDSYPQAVLG